MCFLPSIHLFLYLFGGIFRYHISFLLGTVIALGCENFFIFIALNSFFFFFAIIPFHYLPYPAFSAWLYGLFCSLSLDLSVVCSHGVRMVE